MNKTQYAAYQAAVEHNLKGLEHVSTGACPGCDECGLPQRWEIVIPEAIQAQLCIDTEFDSQDEAQAEIDRAKADPSLVGLDLTGLTVQKMEVSENDRELAEEAHFSWHACESCGSRLGGDRHPAHGVDKEGNILHLSICVDCLSYLNYGQLNDMAMMEIEEG